MVKILPQRQNGRQSLDSACTDYSSSQQAAQAIRDLKVYLNGYVAGGGKLNLDVEETIKALDYAYLLLVDRRAKAERAIKELEKSHTETV